jgi:hypothetical protein
VTIVDVRHDDPEPLGGRQGVEGVAHLPQELVHEERVASEGLAARLYAREVEHLVDQAQEVA